jgi:hypothetical protein
MSTTFKDFLQEQAKKHQAETDAGKAVVDEWRTAIEHLFDQIQKWLSESDPGHHIEIEKSEKEVTEPGLGRYRVPRLNLRVFGKWIGIIPKARRTVGTAHPPQISAPQRAEGRVDITDELRRYVLYRFPENDRDAWFIDDLAREEKTWPGQVQYIPMPQLKPLNQEAFEKALMSYLL